MQSLTPSIWASPLALAAAATLVAALALAILLLLPRAPALLARVLPRAALPRLAILTAAAALLPAAGLALLAAALAGAGATAGTVALAALPWLATAGLLAIGVARVAARGLTAGADGLASAVAALADAAAPGPAPLPPEAPAEFGPVQERLTSAVRAVRTRYTRLRRSIAQGEKLRAELIYVLSNREKEITEQQQKLHDALTSLEQQSRVDDLTGTANRRWFMEFMQQTWRSGMRNEEPVSLLCIGIDGFADYRESHGRLKSEICLKAVARTIRRIVGRSRDIVARFDGEQFMILLSDTALDGALAVGDNIRRGVAALSIPLGRGEAHTMTVSVGATSTIPSRHSQPDVYVQAARHALSNAAEAGNNVAYTTMTRTGLYQALCLTPSGERRLS